MAPGQGVRRAGFVEAQTSPGHLLATETSTGNRDPRKCTPNQRKNLTCEELLSAKLELFHSLGMQIARSRYCLQTFGLKVGIVYVLGSREKLSNIPLGEVRAQANKRVARTKQAQNPLTQQSWTASSDSGGHLSIPALYGISVKTILCLRT